MNRKKLWTGISIVAFGLQLLAQIFTALIVWKLNVLPAEYAVPALIGFAALLALTAAILFIPLKKKPVSGKRRLIACIVSLIIVIACTAVSAVIANLYSTMQEVTTAEPAGIVRSVYVRKDDPAQTLEDASSYQFAYVDNYDETYTQLAIITIEKQLSNSIKTKTYASAQELADALLAGETEAIILNDAYFALLEEFEAFADFSEKVRLLCDVTIDPTLSVPQEEQPKEPVVSPPKEIEASAFVMYISGSDTRSTKLDVSRSDVNILAVVNPQTKQILLVNTPRDYYVPNPAGDGALDKLTHCGIYGVECSIKALSDLYDVQVNYYSQVNFTGFETLIDAIGGITVYSDVSFTTIEGTWIQAGQNNLNGAQALQFARERYNLSGGDNARGKNQMKVIKAVIEKMTSGTTLIKNYSDILKSLEGMFVTSLKPTDISMLVKMQLSDSAQWNINTFAVTGTGGSERTYSMPGSYAYVMYPHEDVVEYASDLIQRVIDGDVLTEQDMQYK